MLIEDHSEGMKNSGYFLIIELLICFIWENLTIFFYFQVVPSQPAFKVSRPIHASGDSKWPPKQNEEPLPTQTEVNIKFVYF